MRPPTAIYLSSLTSWCRLHLHDTSSCSIGYLFLHSLINLSISSVSLHLTSCAVIYSDSRLPPHIHPYFRCHNGTRRNTTTLMQHDVSTETEFKELQGATIDDDELLQEPWYAINPDEIVMMVVNMYDKLTAPLHKYTNIDSRFQSVIDAVNRKRKLPPCQTVQRSGTGGAGYWRKFCHQCSVKSRSRPIAGLRSILATKKLVALFKIMMKTKMRMKRSSYQHRSPQMQALMLSSLLRSFLRLFSMFENAVKLKIGSRSSFITPTSKKETFSIHATRRGGLGSRT